MQYRITNVNRRGEWRSRYATSGENDMVDWAIALDGEQGWIKLTQKLTTSPPTVGQTIEGKIETKTSTNGESYRAFKKENPNQSGARSGSGDTTRMEARLEYAISILEQLAGMGQGSDVGQTEDFSDPFPDL